ncbi:MAG TPA: hypothetical protein DCE22_00010, partial [Verrucomicrobiales bacterium]|nr:hypothetical protein [Verrucomicrobiales bacterium]
MKANHILILIILSAEFSLSEESNVNKIESEFRSIISNSSFEEGKGDAASGWTFTNINPPIRSGSDAHT